MRTKEITKTIIDIKSMTFADMLAIVCLDEVMQDKRFNHHSVSKAMAEYRKVSWIEREERIGWRVSCNDDDYVVTFETNKSCPEYLYVNYYENTDDPGTCNIIYSIPWSIRELAILD